MAGIITVVNAAVGAVEADMGELGGSFFTSKTAEFLLMLMPILFVIFLGVIDKLIRKKLDSDFDKNMNPKLMECSTYGIYRKGYVFAYIISCITFALAVLLAIFEGSLISVALLFTTIFTITFLSIIDYVPNFLFKCPKCEERKLRHFRKTDVFSYINKKKRIYFKCESCGFEIMEYKFIHYNNDN